MPEMSATLQKGSQWPTNSLRPQGQARGLKKADIQKSDTHPQHVLRMLVLLNKEFRSFSLVKMKHQEDNQPHPLYPTALTKPIS